MIQRLSSQLGDLINIFRNICYDKKSMYMEIESYLIWKLQFCKCGLCVHLHKNSEIIELKINNFSYKYKFMNLLNFTCLSHSGVCLSDVWYNDLQSNSVEKIESNKIFIFSRDVYWYVYFYYYHQSFQNETQVHSGKSANGCLTLTLFSVVGDVSRYKVDFRCVRLICWSFSLSKRNIYIFVTMSPYEPKYVDKSSDALRNDGR